MLKNKVALITGGSRGIGRAIALEMAGNGADVAVIYWGNKALADTVCETARTFGVRALPYCCDVADFALTEAIVKRICEDFGTIDILVNNAGITKDKLIMQMNEEEFDSVLKVNLKGTFNMIKAVSRLFLKKRSGRIINITSVSGMMGNAGQANYSAAKAGVIGLTKTTAKELASRGITCNAIAPGFIKTDMTDALPEDVKSAACSMIPMRQMGEPGDVAALALFLASDAAKYITGEIIKVDGGLYI